MTITQTGSQDNYAYVENDPAINASVTINQTTVALNNSAFVDNDSTTSTLTVNQAASTYDQFSENDSGYVTSIDPGVYIQNDSLAGSVTVNQAMGNGAYAELRIISVKINGSLTIKQQSGFDSYAAIAGGIIGGTVAINQGADSDKDFIHITGRINGSLTVEQGASQEADEVFMAACTVNSSTTITQSSSDLNYVIVDINSSFAGKLTINQAAADNLIIISGSDDSDETPGTDTLQGGLTISQGAGDNYTDLADATIAGAMIINQGLAGVGYNQLDIGSDAFNTSSDTNFSGTVAVNQGDGTDNVLIAVFENVNFLTTAAFTANARRLRHGD